MGVTVETRFLGVPKIGKKSPIVGVERPYLLR
jgi:hypothetical protein